MGVCTLVRFSFFSLAITALVFPLESWSQPPTCRTDQSDALLRFKNSFSIAGPASVYSSASASYPKTASWRENEDCCLWDGVTCDNVTGNVIGLDLSSAGLQGTISSNSSLFLLRYLRSLSLTGNRFLGSSISPEIRVFSGMTHLNLSSSDFVGVVPAELSHLSKLVSLDLSGNTYSDSLSLELPNAHMGMLIGNLTELEELDLSQVDMSAVILTSLMNFTLSLTSIKLRSCLLGGRLPYYMLQLPNLHELDLSRNSHLLGTLPESNWNSGLVSLSLSDCSFTGEVPRSIGNLPQLTFLDLSRNNFTGHVNFQTFSVLKNLRFLGLSGLSVSGGDAVGVNNSLPKLKTLQIEDSALKNFPCFLPIMQELRQLSLQRSIVSEVLGQCNNNGLVFPQLEVLNMGSCNLTNFPSFLSHSKKIRYVYLSGNLIEHIPSWFFSIGIDTLEELELRDNLLKGGFRLPWKRLDSVDLSNNSFEGPLPVPAKSITRFYAGQNGFSGSIPPSICQLTSLIMLLLHRNRLTGIIPQCLGNLTSLIQLGLSSNSLTGPLPRSLANCTSMQMLDLSDNYINDTSPAWLVTGSLLLLNLGSNRLEGRWPTDTFLQSRINNIILSNNRFEGPPPPPSNATMDYLISNNNFSGEIPSSFCSASMLLTLDMSKNSLTGNLPLCLKNIVGSLKYLNLGRNKFDGVIPEIFQDENRLTALDFSQNRFEGPLPKSLMNCQQLGVLDVGRNMIEDSFPHWLQSLTSLKVLSLRSNKFHGRVESLGESSPFSGLHILDLSDNNLEGYLPEKLILGLVGLMQKGNGHRGSGYLRNLTYCSVTINLKGFEMEMPKINIDFKTLDLSSNSFRGEIPRDVGVLKSLMGLNFSHNRLTGTIPPSLGNLTSLESLDLSSNELVGEIPKELAGMSFLGVLNLSRNNLTGRIPSGAHFNTFSNSSFDGNPHLCGFPLTIECGKGKSESQPAPEQRDDVEDDTGSWFEWKFLAMGYGSGLVIGLSLGYIALETGRPLWLARMVIRLEAKWKNKTKKKKKNATRANCRAR